MFKKDRAEFEKKWDDISIFVKYGSISEEKFNERAKEFLLLKNTESKYFTLDEYREKVQAIQTDKDKNLVYLYTTDSARQDSFIQVAKNRSYDVLLLDGILDSHFINNLEQKLEKTQLKRVDSDTIDKLIPAEIKAETVLTQEEQDKVKAVFENAINNKNMTVAVESLSPDDLPVTITMSEWMRRMKDMAKTGGGYGFYGSMPDQFNVAINANHALTRRILSAENEEQQNRLAKQAYDLGLLSQNMLSGADLTSFIKRSVELVG